MRVLIVDDERPARDKLQRMLELEPDITAIERACDGVDALEQCAAFLPDVAFLDIQMPEVSGIELAASLPAPAPLVVFVTAYDQYALQAFDANAIDYLLKPYDQDRLQRTLARVRDRLRARESPRLSTLPVRQLLVSERGVTRVVKVDDIAWIETADNYVVLHTPGAQPLLRQTLTGLLGQLGGALVRCHRRAAVRPELVERIVSLDKGDCELVLRGGARVPCSRQYRAALMDRLQGQA
ncbi:LytR/AlgR family response regulator transcription factor [Massilia soli]|uniref:Response regulator n=1 Tax=Massilia soli TaxID=2792854 RepID=A0ABS7SQM1_9BURK|nr:response regulator [Massilia soli]MBZ2208243.1 response regulator [Massilia soli]